MTSKEILKADVLDILFDNRNKQYGAYTLRKHYNQRLGMALGISLGSVLLLFLLIRPNEENSAAVPQYSQREVVIDPLELPKPIEPELPKPKLSTPPPDFAQTEFLDPIVVDDTKVNAEMAEQAQLKHTVISNITTDGLKVPEDFGPVELNVNKGDGTGEKKEVKSDPPATELVQKEPEFPGGPKAWLDFLNRHLVVPGELELGDKKTVMIRFQVGVDGRVTGFEVIQSGGSIYDSEVIRVLKKMPKWKPAIQNGQPVSRAFTQPVTFMAVE
jgi:periplasmic protein TonB